MELRATAAIDLPISQRWSQLLKDPLDYFAIQATQAGSLATMPVGFYWCRVSDRNNVQKGGWPTKLYTITGEQGFVPGGTPPKFEQVLGCPLQEFFSRLPAIDSKSTVRQLWAWMLDLDKRLISSADGANPARATMPPTIALDKLKLPPQLAEPIVLTVLESLNSALEELSKRKPSPSGLDESLGQLREASKAWVKQKGQTDEKFESRWKKVKEHLSAWSSGARVDNAITLFGIWDGQAKEGPHFVCPTVGIVAADPRRGTLFAVVEGKPKQIGDVIDGKPIVAPNAPTDLPDGCPVICVSTSPGAKGPAAADQSK